MSPALRSVLKQLDDVHKQRAGASPELPLILQALNMIAEQLDIKQDTRGQAGTAPTST